MRLYTVGYGHNPSGRVYTYIGGNNFRTGQNVVVPVTQSRTYKRKGITYTRKNQITYNTLGTIMRTMSVDATIGMKEADRLSQSGIGLKIIKGRDILNDLPTGRLIRDLGGTKQDWKDMSDVEYMQKTRARLMNMEV